MTNIEMLKEMAKLFHGFADGLLAIVDKIESPDQKAGDEVPWEEYTPIAGTEQAPEDVQATAAKEKKQVTLEEVRAAMAAQSRSGHTAACRALLKKHGASRLSEVDPEDYPFLLAEVEVL